MRDVIVDFDNTLGVPGCDFDDAAALLYLLGHPDKARVQALCTTFGNSTLATVNQATRRFLKTFKINLPLYEGAASPTAPLADAARYMAKAVQERPGELTILATGSLTNLKQAAMINPAFFSQVRDIYLMGGLLQTLIINGTILHELNFSCDPQATRQVLAAPVPVFDATAQSCLPASFLQADFEHYLGADAALTRESLYYFDWMEKNFLIRGTICWDVVAAATMLEPELFDIKPRRLTLNERLLSVGYLESLPQGFDTSRVQFVELPDNYEQQATIQVPTIEDPHAFKEHIFAAWRRAEHR